ncbi:alpha/beta fold hydrolase [Taibaiella sp. KBW10]|uniref:alpha/beta fold hydrolase n=1 Tax=Taibaiella sp. KBW10 TaxID=2153357 RepID=UPI0018F63221|nr:alpha/beta hydrolase [Taibaiella sp. KBW10]
MKHFFSLLLILFIPFMAISQKRLPQKSAIIDTSDVVTINGIRHYLSIKGKDSGKPILFFLHGGPGTSMIETSETFSDQLRNAFIVINWDQRQTGATLQLNASVQPLSTSLLKDDANQMLAYILKKYKRKKLYLVSHSWGSVLGFDIAQKHPELLYAYIAISPIIDQDKAGQLTIDMLQDWAKSEHNVLAQEEIEKVKVPFETKEDLFYSQKWLFIKNGVDFAQKEDFKTNYYKWMNVWFPTWKESVTLNMFRSLSSVDCPIYFIEGNADQYKMHDLVKEYYAFIKAPKKGFYWMTKSGHTVFNTEPEKLQQTIIDIKKATL